MTVKRLRISLDNQSFVEVTLDPTAVEQAVDAFTAGRFYALRGTGETHVINGKKVNAIEIRDLR